MPGWLMPAKAGRPRICRAVSRAWRRARPSRRGLGWASAVLLAAGLGGGLLIVRAYRGSPAFDPVLAGVYALMLAVIVLAVWWFAATVEAQRRALQAARRRTQRFLRERRALRLSGREQQTARDKAEAANQAKTRYMTGLSHELRTPLNAIYGFAQILEKAPDIPAGHRSAITTIRRSSEHLAGLIEGLLDVSRIESGRLEIQRDRIDLRAFLTQIASIFEASAGHKGIEFAMETRGRLPRWIAGDEKRLRQIIINLLSNAIRYTDAGRVDFLFHYRSEVAVMEVRDTGIGIGADEIDTIWLPFRRGRDRRQPGSGLGLTITKLLVEILGGEIRLESEVGKGSTFRVRLLLPSIPDPGPGAPRRDAEPATQPPAECEGRGRTILVVDDDRTHLAMIESFLKPAGFAVRTAWTAEEALAVLPRCRPDLFILDIDLPDLDGWELARRVRAGERATAPIIMISGHAADGLAPDPEGVPCDAFFAKPYRLDGLLARIAGLLNIQPRPVAGSPSAAAPEPAIGGSLPAEVTEELAALASIGRARRLATRLDEIEGAHPDARALIARLRSLHAAFDMPGIVRLLESAPRHGS